MVTISYAGTRSGLPMKAFGVCWARATFFYRFDALSGAQPTLLTNQQLKMQCCYRYIQPKMGNIRKITLTKKAAQSDDSIKPACNYLHRQTETHDSFQAMITMDLPTTANI